MAYTSKPDGSDSIQDSDQVIKANFDFLALAIAQEHGWNVANAALTVHASNFFVGAIVRELDAVAGDVATTGVGFTPDIVLFYGVGRGNNDGLSWSVGGHDGTNHAVVYNTYSVIGGEASASNATYCIYFNEDTHTTSYQRALVKTLDADGFTLTWSTASMESTSETGKIFYVCLKMV